VRGVAGVAGACGRVSGKIVNTSRSRWVSRYAVGGGVDIGVDTGMKASNQMALALRTQPM